MADLARLLEDLAATAMQPFDPDALALRVRARRRRRRVMGLACVLAVLVSASGVGWALVSGESDGGVDVATTPSVETFERASGRPGQVIASLGYPGRVVVLDSATGREIRTLYEAPETGTVGSVSATVASDGVQVYFEATEEPGEYVCAVTYRVPLAGGSVEAVAAGGAPAVSPDGRWLAYAAFRGGYMDVAGGCQDSVVVRDLVSGEERRWTPAPGERSGYIGQISWAPDSVRLAYDVQWAPFDPPKGQSSDVGVLDTRLGGTLAEATRFVPRDGSGEGSKSSPVWLPDDRIATVYQCCDGTEPSTANIYLVDPVELSPCCEAPTVQVGAQAMDIDPAGRFVLSVGPDGRLLRAELGNAPVEVAREAFDAVWVPEARPPAPLPAMSEGSDRCAAHGDPLGDVDGDGRVDAVYHAYFRDNARVGVCTADGEWSEIDGLGQAESLHVADLDGDGADEVVFGATTVWQAFHWVARFLDGALVVVRLEGHDTPLMLTEGGIPNESLDEDHAFGCEDVDRDGRREVVAVSLFDPEGSTSDVRRSVYRLDGAGASLLDETLEEDVPIRFGPGVVSTLVAPCW